MALEKFTFEGKDGKTYTLPKQISSGSLRKVRRLDNLDASYTILEDIADEATLAALDEMDAVDVLKICGEWMQGATRGESSSSSK